MKKPEKTKTFSVKLKYPDAESVPNIISSISQLVTLCKIECDVEISIDDISVYIEGDSDDYNSSLHFIMKCVKNRNYEKQLKEYNEYLNDKKLSDALKIVEESGKFEIKDK